MTVSSNLPSYNNPQLLSSVFSSYIMLSSQKEKRDSLVNYLLRIYFHPKKKNPHPNHPASMEMKKFYRPCEKISVNSTTVIKNDIVERLEKQPLIFLQYTINTVICQGSSTVSLLEWSVAEWKQTDCAGSA